MSWRGFVIRAMVSGIIAITDAEVRGEVTGSARASTRRLIKQLHDVDSDSRVSAAEGLGRERDPAALGVLCSALLGDRDYTVRKWAAMALANFLDEKALDALQKALEDVVPVREAAISSISSIGGRKGASILLGELERKDCSHKLWILGGLQASAEHVDPRRLLPFLQDANDWVAAQTATVIAWTGDESVAGAVLEQIRNRGESLKPAAAYFACVKGDKTAWHYLQGALRTGEELQRTHAALLLTLVPGDESLSALIDQLKTEGPSFLTDAVARRGREGILELLSNLDCAALADPLRIVSSVVGAAGLDPLASALRSTEEDSQRQLLKHCIVLAADLEGVPRLLQFLEDREPAVREAAARAVRVLRERAAVRPLCQLLSDADADVRRHAIISLGLIGDPSCVPNLLEYPARESEAQALIAALGRMGDKRAVPDLVDVLAGAEPDMQCAAADALGLIGDWRAIRPLLRALKNADGDLTCCCVRALGLVGHKSARAALLALCQNSDARIRRHVADALGRVGGGRVLVALVRLLQDVDPSVRERAAIGLGRLGDPRAAPALVAELVRSVESDPQTSHGVLDALQALGDSAVGLLAEELSNPNEEARFYAVLALKRIGTKSSADAIWRLLRIEESERVREAAKEGL